MKRIYTLLLAALTSVSMMAQAHGALKFVGASNTTVATMSNDNASDTITFAMADMESGNITLPQLKGMKNIPSFTISGAKFTMGANHVVTFPEQEFTATVMEGSEEKKIVGSSLTGEYNMADNSFSLKAVFQYGVMPLPLTYTIKGYYVKAVSSAINVNVAGAYDYSNSNVTYNVRKYVEDDVEKLDVEVPEYSLSQTIMGDLTLGSYVVKGLVYDAERGGYYRDYKNDGLKFHFKAVNNGQTTMDNDYAFNPEKQNDILVVYNGNNVTSIVNTFQMGQMPYPIVSTFSTTQTGINGTTLTKPSVGQKTTNAYNLQGQRVSSNVKGIVIIDGKKYINR